LTSCEKLQATETDRFVIRYRQIEQGGRERNIITYKDMSEERKETLKT